VVKYSPAGYCPPHAAPSVATAAAMPLACQCMGSDFDMEMLVM
jgi:hypothetical protein